MADTTSGDPAGPRAATTAADEAAGTAARKEKIERGLAGLVEEASARMREVMAATPVSGTGEAQDAQEAMARLFEGVMATNKRFAEALLDRAEPGPAVELQRQFLGEYFDALARGGTLLLRAAGEAAGKSQDRQAREHGGQEAGGTPTPAGAEHTARQAPQWRASRASAPAADDRQRRPSSAPPSSEGWIASRRSRQPRLAAVRLDEPTLRRGSWPGRTVALRARHAQKTIVIGFAAPQHHLWSWVWGGTNRRTEPMAGTAVFFATLAALVAAKCAARIAINSGDFDGLPQPSQLD